MAFKFIKLIYLIGLGFMISIYWGCADKGASDKTSQRHSGDVEKPIKDPGPNDPNDPILVPADDTLCADLQTHGLYNRYGKFIQPLCQQGLLSKLRDTAFRGTGEPRVTLVDKDLGATSAMTLWTSLQLSIDAKTYFNMMRLAILKPDQFEKSGFEVDQFVTYQIKSQAESSAQYLYQNDSEKPEIVVAYEATSTLHELIPQKLYLVTVDLTKSLETVKQLTGLQIIYQSSANAAQVFSMADQVYDNNNDHKTVVQKAVRAFKKEVSRAYRNAQNKGVVANQFFP